MAQANPYGPVDSDIFVRLGNPKKPLGVKDFDTVSDWKKAKLIEDLSWNDAIDDWKPRGRAKGVGSYWTGTIVPSERNGAAHNRQASSKEFPGAFGKFSRPYIRFNRSDVQ